MHDSPPPTNGLLARLPRAAHRRLRRVLRAVPLARGQVLHETGSPIDHVYFPLRGVVSAMAVMSDGATIEVASVGNEGTTGLLAFTGGASPTSEFMVRAEGEAIRMGVTAFREEAGREGPFRKALLRYGAAFAIQLSATAACNGLHTVLQRCCRWLAAARDRVGSDRLSLTHEFLAIMLGVRRPSVTEVLGPLQERGLIRLGRGAVTVVDRPGLEATACECYRAVRDEYERLLV